MALWSISLRPEDIYHHGIKGMKWGVRRYQNYDGTLTTAGKKRYNQLYDKVYTEPHYRYEYEVEEDINKVGVSHKNDREDIIRKGSVLQRRARVDEPHNNKPKHMSITDIDNYDYGSMSWEYLGIEDYYDDEIKTYQLKRDIKVANAKTTMEHLLKQIGNKTLNEYVDLNAQKSKNGKQIINDLLKYMANIPIKELINTDLRYQDEIRSGMKKKLAKDIYMQRRYEAMKIVNDKAMKTFMQDHDTRDKVIKELSKKGYDAMIDIEDYPWAEYPLIIFKPKNVANLKK